MSCSQKTVIGTNICPQISEPQEAEVSSKGARFLFRIQWVIFTFSQHLAFLSLTSMILPVHFQSCQQRLYIVLAYI